MNQVLQKTHFLGYQSCNVNLSNSLKALERVLCSARDRKEIALPMSKEHSWNATLLLTAVD